MDDDITYPVDDEISDDELRSWACIGPLLWEMLARALFDPAVTIVAVCPDGTEIVVRSGWTERGHPSVHKASVICADVSDALCRTAETAIESGVDNIDEVVEQGLAIIAKAKKSLM
jgi:hypothetical protein